jgi:hypothetical protein
LSHNINIEGDPLEASWNPFPLRKTKRTNLETLLDNLVFGFLPRFMSILVDCYQLETLITMGAEVRINLAEVSRE